MSGPIARTALGGVLDAILEDQATPIRVELTEADGRKYVDILSPVQHLARSTSAVSPPTGERAERATTAAAQQLRQVWGHGFVPGEEVAIAVVTHTVTADEEGRASTLVDRRGLPAHQEGILLFGRISGTLLHDELRS
ncbi:hypothetical protein H490_0101560 [Leucobacter sp. UCD-THU]|nr:hypothetical protein H490_0101560 [Leucobacter sp. UCD-THU]